ncbi:CRABP2 [Lepeophtheirus salmonis]|uniref:CRABP2 n=1 Tax=Lepeophtheirus salmonis TaxID=72036 RepID=A0A7R8D284_LEPSM|nr:CRABP2 [Lepeophtheirus salmonis]CAF2974745.1 CRABP2 [Lepeophtheirus salmonis]
MKAFMGQIQPNFLQKIILKELGVNVLLRNAALVSTPSFESERSLRKLHTSNVRTVNTLVTTFVSEQIAEKDGQKSTKTVRDFKDGKCTQATEVVGSDVKCSQVFEEA